MEGLSAVSWIKTSILGGGMVYLRIYLAEREGVISNSLFEEFLDWEAQLQCLYEDYPEHFHKPFGPPGHEIDGPDLDGGSA
ncbi:MAG: hypothetical protein CMK09_00885 [Ponticaulis sp.]|nr:hypothetical protein [Ponticaulis sp.]|tara:strand:+ start:3803 stop:4045 length:243 start_codon:yes stop_codon:yes gene_type:complete